MIQKSTILFLLLLLIACGAETKNKPIKLDCDSINKLMARDQDLRSTKLQGQFFPKVDSIMKARGYARGNDDLSSIDAELKSEIWAQAKSLERPFSDKELLQRDSLWIIQNEIDSLNTLEVLEQIELFGIDSLNNIDEKCGHNSLIVFVHCPDGLKSKVAEIIEINRTGVGENRYRHISWHVNGRTN